MTTTISDVTLNGEGYTLIAENITSALFQIKSSTAVRIIIATSTPEATATDGVVMDRFQGLAELAMNDMAATDKVYGIALGASSKIGGFTVPAA